MTLVDPLGEAGAPFGFGLSRLLSVRLYLGKPLLPPAHLEPIVGETDLAARVAFAFLGIGMFTGARLNEICQLDIADVKQDGDTWFLNITDEGDDNKRIKSKAGRRKVPLHSELIRLGFLDFVDRSAHRLSRHAISAGLSGVH